MDIKGGFSIFSLEKIQTESNKGLTSTVYWKKALPAPLWMDFRCKYTESFPKPPNFVFIKAQIKVVVFLSHWPT